jgi:hypothetical protein
LSVSGKEEFLKYDNLVAVILNLLKLRETPHNLTFPAVNLQHPYPLLLLKRPPLPILSNRISNPLRHTPDRKILLRRHVTEQHLHDITLPGDSGDSRRDTRTVESATLFEAVDVGEIEGEVGVAFEEADAHQEGLEGVELIHEVVHGLRETQGYVTLLQVQKD